MLWSSAGWKTLRFRPTDRLASRFVSRSMHARSACLTDQQVWFPVDFQETFSRKFSRICSFINIYRAGSLTPGITRILFAQAVAQLKDIYQGLIAPISINPGLLQDVVTGTLWSTRILSQPENFQETLPIYSRFPGGKNYSSRLPGFPGVLDTLKITSLCVHRLWFVAPRCSHIQTHKLTAL